MKRVLLLILILVASNYSNAQETFPVNGSHDIRPEKFAIINATLVSSPTKKSSNTTMLVEKGIITYVGNNKNIPNGYVIYDLEGKYVYPSFIDAYTTYGVEQPEASSRSWNAPQIFESPKKGAYNWNEAIRPETRAYQKFSIDAKTADALQGIGFGAVQTLVKDGIARGSSALVSLAKTKEHKVMLKSEAAAHYSFDKGSSKNSYPSSIMGSVALLRQTYYDAEWYAKQNKEYNISLQEFYRLQDIPQIFEANNVLDFYRINRIADEFNVRFIVKSTGDEYQKLADIKEMNLSLIVPIKFPDKLDVKDPLEAKVLPLSELKHWEMAPANLAFLVKEEIPFSITTEGIKPQEFWKNLRKAMKYGLTEEQALTALTLTPAKFLGVEDQLGSLEKGKIANFLIADGPLFDSSTHLLENWIQGHRNVLQTKNQWEISGNYEITNTSHQLLLKQEDKKVTAEIKIDAQTKKKAEFILDDRLFALQYQEEDKNSEKRIQGYVSNIEPLTLTGKIYHEDGTTSPWLAKRETQKKTSKEDKKLDKLTDIGDIIYPFVAYGSKELPTQQNVLFKNVTAWTNEAEGIVENIDVYIRDGKIHQIGKGLSARGKITIIDGTGKHLTPGIIDEHSHIALQSINEGAQSVSSEVRMKDALNSEDIAIYRQLSGGVTTSHLLHGSANPIGGQTQVIKLRWGQSPEGLLYGDNMPSIKFALGENVKQSNWGVGGQRFPQTRMGVEQVFVDGFTRAKEYHEARTKDNKLVRRDLELDALVEILKDQRYITCHSYVQSEINMLMEVAEKMNFRINTFTHIMEGYKIADKMAERGIAAATFSDWWAYKIEVADAIPHNASLMHQQKVLTAINSDDAEMARRLNQEAAKVIKYGGATEEEAFKMVTLNPAKMMHIDDKVGSLKVGKDADVVLWSHHPLSIYAKAEQTYIEGIKYWDIEEHEQKVKNIELERARIIKKLLDSPTSNSKNNKAK